MFEELARGELFKLAKGDLWCGDGIAIDTLLM